MCTIVILQRAARAFPLVVAANRDELYARPAAPPRVIVEQAGAVGGVDLVSGGTWLGVTRAGFVVGLTNQRGSWPPDPTARSRGPVVVDALRAGDADGVERMLAELDAREYNPFNLLFGDAGGGLRVAYARRDARELAIERVPDGVHVLPNDRLDAAGIPKTEWSREAAESARELPWPALASRLHAAMADHRTPDHNPLDAQCVHTPVYGTRCSSLLALEPGRVARFLHADGPPCVTDYADVTSLVTGSS